MVKLIYPKYAMWVFIYTILFSLSSVLYGKLLDIISLKYDRVFLKENEKKSKLRLIIEVCLQLGATSVGVYIFREIINFAVRSYFKIEKKPDEFAVVVVAPIIFSQQANLMYKIETLYDNVFNL